MILCCGVLIINFVTEMAGVAVFRSEGVGREKMFHYGAAVSAIITFWCIHVLICVYLHKFAHSPDNKYTRINNVYLALTVLFFVLWWFIVLSDVAKVIEWIILFNGLLLQCYAEYSLKQHTHRVHSTVNMLRRTLDCKRSVSLNLAGVLFNFVCTCVVFCYTAPPWFLRRNVDKTYLNTGPHFWASVIAANVVVATQILCVSYYARCFPIVNCVDFGNGHELKTHHLQSYL